MRPLFYVVILNDERLVLRTHFLGFDLVFVRKPARISHSTLPSTISHLEFGKVGKLADPPTYTY